MDIKSFVAEKSPSRNNEFTATVAYFYRFEAQESDRKESISAADLQEACRLVSHGIQLGDGDEELFWEIAKSISRQVLK